RPGRHQNASKGRTGWDTGHDAALGHAGRGENQWWMYFGLECGIARVWNLHFESVATVYDPLSDDNRSVAILHVLLEGIRHQTALYFDAEKRGIIVLTVRDRHANIFRDCHEIGAGVVLRIEDLICSRHETRVARIWRQHELPVPAEGMRERNIRL